MGQADVLLVTATETESRCLIESVSSLTGALPSLKAIGTKTYHSLGPVGDITLWLMQCEMGSSSYIAA